MRLRKVIANQEPPSRVIGEEKGQIKGLSKLKATGSWGGGCPAKRKLKNDIGGLPSNFFLGPLPPPPHPRPPRGKRLGGCPALKEAPRGCTTCNLNLEGMEWRTLLSVEGLEV